jgi:hypothetical protein
MEMQWVINTAAGIAFTALGWFAREMWTAVKELKSDLSRLREELPKTYLPKDDFKESVKELKDMLNDIYSELRKKADK